VDVTSPEGVPDGLRFAGNLLAAHKSGYGVDEADVAIVICLRHGATPYGYADPIWSKYGKTIDAKSTPTPAANPYNSGSRTQVADLARRGVHFMVCGVATRGLAGRIAGPGGDTDAVLKEMGANLVPNARIVPAGVIGVTHAQERGFALLYVG
jgi:intracellular sulfur oxidation DsrE/DsrF family protein